MDSRKSDYFTDSEEDVSKCSFNGSRRKSLHVRRSIYANKLKNPINNDEESDNEEEIIVPGSDEEDEENISFVSEDSDSDAESGQITVSESDETDDDSVIGIQKKNKKRYILSSAEEDNDGEVNSSLEPLNSFINDSKMSFDHDKSDVSKHDELSNDEFSKTNIRESSQNKSKPVESFADETNTDQSSNQEFSTSNIDESIKNKSKPVESFADGTNTDQSSNRKFSSSNIHESTQNKSNAVESFADGTNTDQSSNQEFSTSNIDESTQNKSMSVESFASVVNETSIDQSSNRKFSSSNIHESTQNKSNPVEESFADGTNIDQSTSNTQDKSKILDSYTDKVDKTKNDESKSSIRDSLQSIKKSESYESNNSTVFVISDDEDIIMSTPTKKFIQPKITMFTPSARLPKKRLVTKMKYDEIDSQRYKLIMDIKKLQSLFETHGQNLPDRGLSLKKQIDANEIKLKTVVAELETIEIDQKSIDLKPKPRNSWDDIQATANLIQPKFTGAQGLSTFNTHKTLTFDRLKQLHSSLETCPADDVTAAQPKGLIVPLMNHQLKAIKWMQWREKQQPRGGILADDMGLGKTLTIISLVMSNLEAEKNESDLSSDDDEDEDDDDNEQFRRKSSTYYGGTLVVCPASLINQWSGEVKQRVKRNLISVCVHHGAKRETKPRLLSKFDMVVTTYAIVKNERADHGALFGIKWERIVLDEAHIIRNYKTAQAEACFLLRGKYRWSLTGTPIQNKETDIYSQLKYLRCTPFDDLKVYKQWIGNSSEGSQERLNSLIQPLLLRRTKVQLNEKGELGKLPNKTLEIISVKLEKDEMNVYQKIMTYSKTLFTQFLSQRSRDVDKNYCHEMHRRLMNVHGAPDVQQHQILTLILRLRQICIHPGLIDKMLHEDEELDVDEDADIDLLDHLNRLDINDENVPPNLNDSTAARASSKILLKSNPVYDMNRASSKFKCVLNLVKKIVEEKGDKIVVVSQFSSVLEMFGIFLGHEKIRYCKLTGSVQVKFRNDIVVDFNNPSSRTKVMLLSLTAGGVGLNLIGGNHLVLMDPHWNPQLESQAQDRIFRIGQKKDVFIYKVLCSETIEERIKTLQDKKLSIAADMLAGVKRTSSSKLTIDDMKSLFGIA